MANFSQNLVLSGLGSTSITVPVAGPYFFDAKISLPTLTNGGGLSACLAVVNQNGSPIYTGQAGAEGFRATATCAVGDIMQFVLSSSNTADQGLNVIKTVIALGTGE